MSWGIIIKNVEILRVHKDEIDSKIQEKELEIIDAGARDIEKSDDGIRIITSMEDLQKVQDKIKKNILSMATKLHVL